MGIQFPISAFHGQQYTPPGIPVTWQFDSGRNAWRVVRGGTPWTDITGKPATFPPSAHQHPISDVTNLQSTLDVKQDISARGQANGYAPLDSNTKVPPQYIDLGSISWDQIPGKPAEFPPSPHTHPVVEISDSGTTGQQLVRSALPIDARNIIGAIGPDDNARVSIEKNGGLIGIRRTLNFIEGSNITISVVDDPAQEDLDITFNASGGSTGTARYSVTEVKPSAPFDNDIWLDVATGIQFTYYNDGTTHQWIEFIPFLATMPTVFTKFTFPPAPADGTTYNPIPGATWKWSQSRGVWFAVTTVSSAYTKAESDANFVDIGGDVMTGPLSVVTPPTANTHAASKQYVDGQDSLKVTKAGDTMTGLLTLSADPTNLLHAATKQYVDTKDGLKADKTYVDTQDAALQTNINAKADKTYVDTQDALKVAKAGDTMTGDLTITETQPQLHLNKTSAANHPMLMGALNGANRWAMSLGDNNTESGADTGGYFTLFSCTDAGAFKDIVLSGRRDTGLLSVKADPTAALGIATKQYVDAHAPPAATAAEWISNSAPTKMLTPGAVWSAANVFALTDAATVTPDLSVASDFLWPIAAAGRTLANFANPKVGQKGVIYVQQAGSGNATITTWGAAFKFPGGTKPVLSTAVGQIDAIFYTYLNSNYILCTFNGNFA